MAPGAQDNWLTDLSDAETFTSWVLAEVSPWLGERILEVGCGVGTYTRKLASKALQVVALDKNQNYADQTALLVRDHLNVKVVCGDAHQLSWLQENAFDTVLLLDVLEHIEEHVAFAKQLASKMAPAGHMIVKVPAGVWLYSPLDVAIGHCRRYSFKTLEQALQLAGLEVVQMWSFNSLALLGWWWNGRIWKRSFPMKSHIRIFTFFLPLIRWIDRYTRPFGGMSIIAIVRHASTRSDQQPSAG